MTNRPIHPSEIRDKYDGWPVHDGWAPGVYTWLQAWYASQCDGDWEHGSGIQIGTLDNPGWTVEIDLEGTDLESRPFDRVELNRSQHEWISAWVADRKFHAACGPLNLGEALFLFRQWADPHVQPSDAEIRAQKEREQLMGR